MAKLKITIEPLALVALFLFIYLGWMDQVLFYIVALTIHEYSHYYIAKRLGYSLNNIKFFPFGAVLNGSKNYFKKSHEIAIALAGPLINLALALLCIAIWWLYPSTHNYTFYFVLANVSLFISNMLPLFPLDMGRIILTIFKDNKNFKKLYQIYRINSIIASIILMILFIITAFNQINLSFVFIAILLISSNLSIKNDMFYNFAYLEKTEADYNKIMPVKSFYIPIDTPKHEFMKLINKNYYSIFVFVDKHGKIIKEIDEKNIIKFLTRK